LIINISNEDLQ